MLENTSFIVRSPVVLSRASSIYIFKLGDRMIVVDMRADNYVLKTRNSTYEVDFKRGRIRRIFYFRTACYRSSFESWKQYETVSNIAIGEPLFIKWKSPADIEMTTTTSSVMEIITPNAGGILN
jgi:hypothetical protein